MEQLKAAIPLLSSSSCGYKTLYMQFRYIVKVLKISVSIFCFVLFFQNSEIVLSEENVRVTKQSKGLDIPYKVHTIGMYLVIEAKNGLVLIWNKKTTIMIKLSPTFKVGGQTYS